MYSLGVGRNSPALIRAIAVAQLGLELADLLDAEHGRDDRVRPLEEVVHDLDLLCAGAEAGERVDEPLEVVVVLDDLLRRPLGERVRLVVHDERAVAVELEHVEPAVQQDAVVLERERALGATLASDGDPTRELRLAVRADERRDPLELLVGHRRVPAAHERGEIVGRQRLAQVRPARAAGGRRRRSPLRRAASCPVRGEPLVRRRIPAIRSA